MNAFFFWEPVGGLTLQHKCNPYAGLLAQELETLDIHLELGDYALEKTWLQEHREKFDVLHLHWLHYFYRRETLEESVAEYAKFAENLTYAKNTLGYKIVWTLHNVYPHERPFPQLDHCARLLVCELADEVLCHCKYAQGIAEKLFHRTENVQVIPHGNFIDAFPNDISQTDARRQLGVADDRFVYLFFGNARAYKGIEHLVAAFLEHAKEDAVLLLMMRKAFDVAYAEEVEGLAQKDARIKVFTSEYFPEADFQIYINAADVAVFPFAEVLTSGSAITALSFGKPVVMPQLGCLPELIDDRMGVIYDAKSGDGLGSALAEVRTLNIDEANRATMARALELNWKGIAEKLA
ncbi:MAG: glycosyltransferase, partial [Candidatus Latescibacteria bacterium]|nr:glycosyltransferase [Candidatus Latescibacterota bacterium]